MDKFGGNEALMGLWWDPKVSERSYQGTLQLDSANELVLDFAIPRGDSFFDGKSAISTLNGVVGSLGEVTSNSLKRRVSSPFQPPGVQKVSFGVQEVIRGAQFTDDHEQSFTYLSTSYSHLTFWTGLSGLAMDFLPSDGISASFAFDEQRAVTARIGSVDIKIYPRHFGSGSRTPHESSRTIGQRVWVDLRSDEGLSTNQWMADLLLPLSSFFSFVTSAAVRLREVNAACALEQVASGHVQILRREIHGMVSGSDQFPTQAIPFSELSPLLDRVLNRWMQIRSELSVVIELYFSARVEMERRGSTQKQFIDLVQALEYYHRVRYPSTTFDKADWKRLRNQMVDAVPHEYQQWARRVLGSSNEASLHDRIVELLKKAQPLSSKVVHDLAWFARKVTDTRNYVTHYSSNLKERKFHEKELWVATQQLMLILQMLLLVELGVENELAAELLAPAVEYSPLRIYQRG